MVITRSQVGAAEMEEKRRLQAIEREQLRNDSLDRLRNIPLDQPASPLSGLVEPNMASDKRRERSPAKSSRSHRSTNRSHRSNVSVTTRRRLAELEAAEKLAEIKRLELKMEADLVKMRLAAEVAAIQEDESGEEEQQAEPPFKEEPLQKVNEWLIQNPVSQRGEGLQREEPRQTRFQTVRARSPTPTRTRSSIEHLAATLEKMARPRSRHIDLPTFSGAVNEWLPFYAAYRDSSQMYELTAAENLQRLRTCLKGEARDRVSALLYTAADPNVVMKTLEQCFGRPEVIIDQALEELKKLPKPNSTAADLNSFAVKIQNIICVLKTIDRRGYLFNPMLTREVLDKLSPHLRSRWCDYAFDQEGSADPEIVVMSRFLMREADRALRYTYAPVTCAASTSKETRPPVTVKSSANRNGQQGTVKKSATVYSTSEDGQERSNRCPECERDHVLPECPKYKALTVDQRWNLVREKRICFKCAQKKHRRFQCRAKPCGVNECRRPHHSSLHQDQAEPEQAMPADKKESVLSVASGSILHTEPKTVLLKMCPVVIAGPKGKRKTFALLDEGATITLIDQELAASIGAEGPSHPLHLRGVNMSQSEAESQLVTVKIRGVKESDEYQIRARTMKDLKLHQQGIPNTMLSFDHLKDLDEEEVCFESARPGILVGTDHWECIVSRDLRIGEPNQPAASKTRLGWVVHGTAPRRAIYEGEDVLHIYERANSVNPGEKELHDLVEAHFKIEALGVQGKPRMSEVHQRAVTIVERTIKKTDVGYEVGLPWRRDKMTMPASYNQALRRLKRKEIQMDADPVFKMEYTQQIENLLKKGYATPCDGSEDDSPVKWFLCHFAVTNPNKPGYRLVFDAAARNNGVSLNDELLEGPDMLLSLPGILFRFREGAVAITADIQEMFLRIKVRPEDQPAQQFLWRGEDRERPPKKYKMTSVFFGATSSPYIAHHVRNHNADIHGKEFPRALEAIKNAHYMDDWVASFKDAEEARKAVEETREVHARAGFNLKGWNSSDPNILKGIPSELHATAPTQLGGEQPGSKILGLYWNAQRDELGFNTCMSRVPEDVKAGKRAPTKREALSAVMSVYDPLGLLSHYTIRSKIILQSLWRLQMTWDEPIPAEENELFTSWLAQLPEIAMLRLPRCYTLNGYERIDLHILCDASEQAFATTAYWRITRNDGTIEVVLIAAKAKVAPKKALTIPRLELQAAVIGARLAETIKREHRMEVDQTTYWTDSSTVVHRVRNDMRRYTPFVAHRLGEIAELTQKEEWRWLPTDHNVTDDATRLTNAPISSTDRWFQGPDFLYLPEDQWPGKTAYEDTEEEVLHVSENPRRSSCVPDPARFSKYEILVRTTARVLAFVDICRRRAINLEHRHIERAEKELIRRVQEDSFQDEVERIRSGRTIPKASRLYRLDPVMEDGILRVRGRIGASAAPSDTKRPVILDGRHPITKLLVLREHCSAGHANRERVTNDLRQHYWIIHLRPTVRAIEKNCAFCRRRRAMPTTPATGDLPLARMDPFHRPFTNCGVDYFGPMMIKIGRRREKRWGALFTCLTSRAVHIEIVASLSTDSTIMALRRMAARRGWPRLMYSDNGTNFRGADQELRLAYKEWLPKLQDEGLLHRMEWRFIPPGAPNQGGAWERMVRSVKTALRVTLREKAPTEEVLRTLLTEAEFSINARPLTHVSVNPADPEALTPNHFLIGSSTGMPATGPCDEADRRTWRASMALADHFWKRWVREYLPTLVPRGDSSNKARPLRIGDVVLIVDSTLPRNTWPMGLVKSTYPGPDGGIRVAEVRTRTGVFRRPVSELAVVLKEEDYASCAGGRTVTDGD
ncbi:uncharacterized protein LOC123307057 [Coccinella septempunctata]|uniref:uncharacterized protein LOC123307057 n=1 Tax=Coccinella septempunctata TaxID=41139 RepID=UPI001D099D48|nr:uncharacterized protein LOC123307057 [Coccinella septempunctata]